MTLTLTASAALTITREGGTGDRDGVYGYPGDDELHGYDGVKDFNDCNPGIVTAKAESLVDILHNCEYVAS